MTYEVMIVKIHFGNSVMATECTCMFTLTYAYSLTYFGAKCVQNRISKAYSINHSLFTFKSLHTFLLRWVGFYVYNIYRTDRKLRPTKHNYLAKPPNQKCQRRSADLFHFSKDIRCFNWNLRTFFYFKKNVKKKIPTIPNFFEIVDLTKYFVWPNQNISRSFRF